MSIQPLDTKCIRFEHLREASTSGVRQRVLFIGA
jgi:hypothetical protein